MQFVCWCFAGATSKRGEGENRLLETTIRKQNVAKLRRELIYIYKLPPATDEDYEEELKVDWHTTRRGGGNNRTTAGGVWFFDDLDTDHEDYLEVLSSGGSGGSNNHVNNLPGSSNKRVPHRFSPATSITNTPSKNKPFTNNRFHVNVKADREINRSQQPPGTLTQINVQNFSDTTTATSSTSLPSYNSTPNNINIIPRTSNVPNPESPREKSPTGETTHHHHHHHQELSPDESPPSGTPTNNSSGEKMKEEKKRKYFNTGHFRKSHAIIWDPHPQYIFHAFAHRFHLILNLIPQRHSFLTPHLTITTHSNTSHKSGNDHFHSRHKDNESFVWRDNLREEISGCFYNGFVLGDPHSSVAVSLCHGMV